MEKRIPYILHPYFQVQLPLGKLLGRGHLVPEMKIKLSGPSLEFIYLWGKHANRKFQSFSYNRLGCSNILDYLLQGILDCTIWRRLKVSLMETRLHHPQIPPDSPLPPPLPVSQNHIHNFLDLRCTSQMDKEQHQLQNTFPRSLRQNHRLQSQHFCLSGSRWLRLFDSHLKVCFRKTQVYCWLSLVQRDSLL